MFLTLRDADYQRSKSGRPVEGQLACKVLDNKPDMRDLEREIQIHMTLHHKNLVELIDVVRTDKKTYLLMEYCSEVDLKKFIHSDKLNGRLDEEDAKYVIQEVLQGLFYLSQQKIMHRDIKMDNIIVNHKKHTSGYQIEDFEFKLGDLGLAK